MPTSYRGPGDVWRRYMGGMKVTYDNLLADDSLWIVRPMSRYELERMNEMVLFDAMYIGGLL